MGQLGLRHFEPDHEGGRRANRPGQVIYLRLQGGNREGRKEGRKEGVAAGDDRGKEERKEGRRKEGRKEGEGRGNNLANCEWDWKRANNIRREGAELS